MHPSLRIYALPPEQRKSIARLRKRVNWWFADHPERAVDFHSITLFGSRAVGLGDPELSDWDLYVIMQDDATDGPSPADDLSLHDDCLTEWHRNSVTGYFDGLEWSSLDLSRAVEKHGIPIYGNAPESPNREIRVAVMTMNIDHFNAHLLGILDIAGSIPAHVRAHLRSSAKGFPDRTRKTEPYDPVLFKQSSNFAEQVIKLIAAFRGITPRSTHRFDILAEELDARDPYRKKIAFLKGATRDRNIGQFFLPAPPPSKTEDEPVQRSIERLIGTFCLFREFLEDYGDRIEIRDEHKDIEIDFNEQVECWQLDVVEELFKLVEVAESACWLGQIADDAKVIGTILGRYTERLQSVSH